MSTYGKEAHNHLKFFPTSGPHSYDVRRKVIDAEREKQGKTRIIDEKFIKLDIVSSQQIIAILLLIYSLFHAYNVDGSCMAFELGCHELLSISGISIKEMKAVVVGRSNIVGLPVSLLLIKMDATVTVVQSRTPDPESHIREADIGIVVTGQTMMWYM
ncbi:uncharacterized protein LOC108192482 [Daucus carota subsp. sativus]|uniref:uncharacterized protein LOC108192482 n=1 Tax=Daucus carota subsp. sativus TaxID=79200 RepID=UPI0007EFB802|nr:PREDICTED: bifunctional protein FolD-like [Daucus carota subsp. sativus]